MVNHCLLVLTITILSYLIIDFVYIHGITPAYINFEMILIQLLALILITIFITFKFKICYFLVLAYLCTLSY